MPVQRTGAATAGQPATDRTEGVGKAGADVKGAEIIARLSQSIEQHKMKRNAFAPGTWWPEQWMVAGSARLKRTLDRRVMRGETFNDQDLADIERLSKVNPRWLESVGIGTYEQAQAYLQGQFNDWLKLPAGKRVLTATLAVRAKHPAVRPEGEDAPTSPDYTLGRFMLTQASGTSPGERTLLEDERNRQIRETAINTLHPAGIAPEHRHPSEIPTAVAPTGKGKGKGTVPDYVAKDARARAMLTKVLLILRHGLKLYDPQHCSTWPTSSTTSSAHSRTAAVSTFGSPPCAPRTNRPMRSRSSWA
ncbi:hypothetical protein [Actinacidiphila oryziradicis]|uniref:hypothetical protein n=1 Tax=Actinacidiphila oryziradicis TaxID=2571141 RepID=UPI001FE76BBA|nr:hypothetical protein [Actinacidiphila oryziradicis]